MGLPTLWVSHALPPPFCPYFDYIFGTCKSHGSHDGFIGVDHGSLPGCRICSFVSLRGFVSTLPVGLDSGEGYCRLSCFKASFVLLTGEDGGVSKDALRTLTY